LETTITTQGAANQLESRIVHQDMVGTNIEKLECLVFGQR
jgi:hypothetical protein